MWKVISLIIGLFAILVGCQPIICNAPYIQIGTECCLDADHNNVCDMDEEVGESSRVVITEEKEKVVEKEVTKFVCPDGSIVTSPSSCPIEEEEEEEEEEIEIELPKLVTTNENGTVIESVEIKPSCTKGVNGGQISFKVGTVPSNIEHEVKEVGGEYTNVYSRTGIYSGYTNFAICDGCKVGDFKLKPDTVYVFRMMFNQTNVFDRLEYSNEHLIDTREDSAYRLKICSR